MAAWTIYIGNLASDTIEADLTELFLPYGPITNASIERDDLRERAQGFVQMDEAPAKAAIDALEGSAWRGRILLVNRARAHDHFARRT